MKRAICEIIGDPYDHKDWAGERSDVMSYVRFKGQRVLAAMLLKGPAIGPIMYPRHLGARGDQLLRLMTEPAELLILQCNGQIDSSVHSQFQNHASVRIAQGRPTSICIINGLDTARLLRAYGKA